MSAVAEPSVFTLKDWLTAQAALTQHVKEVSQRISKRVRNVLEQAPSNDESVRDRVAHMLWVAASRA